MPEKENLEEKGAKKAALFFVSLPPEVAAQVMSHMDQKAIEEISTEIAKLQTVDVAKRDAVLKEFFQLHLAQKYIKEGGVDYAKVLLKKTLPADQADNIITTLERNIRPAPFKFLDKADPDNLLTFIQDEHPQTISLILSHMKEGQAATVLKGLPASKQVEVVKRVATLEQTTPEVIDQVQNALEARLSGIVGQELRMIDGVKAIAQVLNLCDRGTMRGIIDKLEGEDPDLVAEIKKNMFVFEDLTLVNDAGIQRLLREIDQGDLATALKPASEQVQEKVFKNMSTRAREILQESMDIMPPLRLADVEQAQARIIEEVRKLEEREELIIQRGEGSEEVIV